MLAYSVSEGIARTLSFQWHSKYSPAGVRQNTTSPLRSSRNRSVSMRRAALAVATDRRSIRHAMPRPKVHGTPQSSFTITILPALATTQRGRRRPIRMLNPGNHLGECGRYFARHCEIALPAIHPHSLAKRRRRRLASMADISSVRRPASTAILLCDGFG